MPNQQGKGDEEQKPKSVQPGDSIFDGDEMDLVGKSLLVGHIT